MAPSYSDQRPSASGGLYPPRRHHAHRSRDPSPEPPRLDARYNYPRYSSSAIPSRNPSRAPSPLPPVYPNTPVKRTWPPSPAVEDEKASLAKEASGHEVADSEKSEASSRGSVDQQPILLEVQAPENCQPPLSSQRKPCSRDSTHTSCRDSRPRRDSSDSKHRGRRDSAEDVLNLLETPLLTRRAPSPYVFTPKAPESHRTSFADSGYFSSRLQSAQPTPSTERGNGNAGSSEYMMSDALRGNGKIRNNDDKDASVASGFDLAVDRDLESAISSHESRVNPPYSFARSNTLGQEGQPEVRDFAKAGPQPRLAEIKGETRKGQRRSSGPASTSIPPEFGNASSSPAAGRRAPEAPIVAPSVGHYTAASTSRGSSRPSSGSRPSSPVDTSYSRPSSPTRLPRFNPYPYKNDSPRSARSSISGSGSRPSSPVGNYPPQSYAMPLPEEGVRRSSTFPAILEDRAQRTSRLADSGMHIDDYSRVPIIPSPTQGRASSSLPYPVDDMNLMPSEEYHRYRPRELGDAIAYRPSPSSSRPSTRDGPTGSPITSRPASLEVPPGRPSVNLRHISTGAIPTLATGAAAGIATMRGEPSSPSTPRQSFVAPGKSRARCLKVQTSRDYENWYTLPGCVNFDVCPACFDSYVVVGNFKKSFSQVLRREPDPNIKCHFRTPWYKLAWQLTQEQQRLDLGLLYAVAQISESEAGCPGKDREKRSWHAIYDRRGEPAHGFDICSCDVKKVEALMPTLRGVFKESHNSGRRRRCNVRIESTRCAEYLEELRTIDAAAVKKKNQPDMKSFVDLARHKAQMRECARDDLVVNKEWHFAPQLPDFTVCEECYSSVVWPAIKDGSSVANRFKRTPELVYEEKETGSGRDRDSRRNASASTTGTSCQLYSSRMRRVFQRAVDSDSFGYLATRAQERKEKEIELQAKYARLQVETKEWEKSTAKSGDRRSLQSQQRYAGIMADFDMIAEAWRKWE